MTRVQSMINAALAAPTASERLANYLSLDPKGLPGGPNLRARQDLFRRRLAAVLPWVHTAERDWSSQRLKVFAGQVIDQSWTGGPGPEHERYETPSEAHVRRLSDAVRRNAETLAKEADMYWDEHGSTRGDYRTTRGLDFLWPHEARLAPYFDGGGRGLGLIAVNRRRVYAKSSKWYPRDTETRFLVGRNEAGTFFAHAVPRTVSTVRAAVEWIWSGKASRIIARQGDIALIISRGPARIPKLPAGHRVNETHIYHETHPPIPRPGPGQAIIVARRAMARASRETRD